MTSNEILKANLLDIIFENRNRDYGAYDLRKGYNKRLLISLATGLSVILLFIVISGSGKSKNNRAPVINVKEGIVIKTIIMPKEKIVLLEKPKEVVKKKAVVKTATVNYTSPPKIEKDDVVKNAMVAVKELDGKDISDKTMDGKEATDKVDLDKKVVEVTGNTLTAGPSQPEFVVDERAPAFPGGQDALRQFLGRNLKTPADLENGEKKIVQIRFKVDKDGSVTGFEILTSGGSEFDKEVIRVCKKMPRWVPALQNGINVPVNFVLPVTFIGVEE